MGVEGGQEGGCDGERGQEGVIKADLGTASPRDRRHSSESGLYAEGGREPMKGPSRRVTTSTVKSSVLLLCLSIMSQWSSQKTQRT